MLTSDYNIQNHVVGTYRERAGRARRSSSRLDVVVERGLSVDGEYGSRCKAMCILTMQISVKTVRHSRALKSPPPRDANLRHDVLRATVVTIRHCRYISRAGERGCELSVSTG